MISRQEASYKKWHGANQSDKARFYQGYYHPKNAKKCLSKMNVYRSSWELKFMEWADRNPAILQWASEPIPIKYLNPVANIAECKKNNLDPKNPENWKLSNYWTDFWIETKKNGITKRTFIEIKPYAQTQKPYPINESAPLKDIRRYNRNAETYLVNMAKWTAARKYFKAKGCDFLVITERTLEKIGLL